MEKDREGKFHPAKGKPSGSPKDEGVGLNAPITGSLDNYLELADKYTEGPDEMPANVKLRHPNRNVNKGEERRTEKNANKQTNKSKEATFNDDQVPTKSEEWPGILTKELFQELANYQASICVSIYMQTHRAGVEVNEQADNIAFKNSLQEITNTLKQKGTDQTVIQKLLEPGYELLRNDSFWRNLNHGLALFIADGFFKYIKMNETPQAEVLMNNSFFLKPLVNAMTVKEYFYLLVISKKQAKLFKADYFGMQLIEIDEMPNGVEDVIHFDEKGNQKLFRTESGGAGRGANYHGQGSGAPDEKEHLAIYLQEVDETIWKEVLSTENVPLLLAGVEYLLPIYKSVSSYKYISDQSITGSQEHEDLNILYSKAREVMEPYFRERTTKALENYANQSATALTSTTPEEVIPAAHYGRIWHLFVRKDEHIWGTFDEMENKLILRDAKEDDDECLMDKAVIKTILNGGDVHFLNNEDMPEGSVMAALMRY
ncbi:MAG TPA: hypothetical protein VKZ95_03350 [Sphingobacteriaceae bacterium]|nr:hypothetical protein [Sphingobacteriaceae bacterium]